MLSVENPPPDPSCPCDVPQLKDSSDESAAHKLPLSEVDLAKQPLFDETPLPKFSIRDYVFTARRKDIKRNWPFSLKNLQLCLNHGVKDLLPPFQPLEAVRRRCTVENENIISNTDGELSVPDHDRVVLDSSDDTNQLNGKLADVCNDIAISCRSEGENDFPSTITSVSQSEIEESVPTNGPGSSPFKADNSLEASVEVEVEAEAEAEAEATCPPVAQKTESSTRTSSKKCRLVVKFSTHSDRSSTEDIASICTNVSETMASKICPVCKTFSSSSNTTLNAHIDQCLSVESTPKGTVESKLTRRIKPRKTKLMVDIYSTAAPCTLEDLDRRNGSSWALVSSFTSQDIEKSKMPAEDKKQRMLPVHPDIAVDVGPVYIDANGTKLRILSKFDDAPSVSKVLEHLRPRKPLKGGKGNKFLSTKKKKCHASKYHKYLKLTSQSKKLLSSKVLSSQICRGQERYSGLHESYGKGGRPIQKQLNHCNSGNLRQWVCSKRTGVAKKLNNKVCRQPFECKWHVSQDSRVENDQSYLHDSLMDESSNRELMNLSGKQISSPKNSERIESVFYEGQNSDQQEQSLRRKRAGNPLSGASIRGNAKGLHPPMKRNASQLWKNSTTRNGTVDICADPIDTSDLLPGTSTKQSRSCQFSRSKAMKISSLRKSSLSFSSRVSLTESESTVTNKNMVANIGEEIVARESEEDQPYDFMHNCAANQSGREAVSNEMSLHRGNGLEIRQKTGVLGIPERKEVMVLENSQVAPQCYQDDGAENTDAAVFISKVDSIIPVHKEVRWSIDDIVTQPSSTIAVGKTVSNFLSMDPELKNLGDHSKAQGSSLQRRGPLCEAEEMRGLIEPSFIGRQEMFCADEVQNGMVVENVDIGEQLDSKVGRESSFPEVDPIPIPGPPGSFLPSPRDMGSEDFQGNSSLTTSRVQSSQDQHDFVDGDSSDSPVSEASTISNFTATRCDPKYCEPLSSVGPKLVQERVRSSLSGGSLDSSVENAVLFAQTTSTATERLTSDREKLKVNKIPLSFKGDDQPCCCQRKERDPQGVTLNYQESQLLRRRAMGLVMVPAMEKQIGGNMDIRLEGRSETFYPSSCSTSKSEKVALPVVKCPASPNLLRDSVDVGVKFSGRNDCDSISPSSSNSILRLMGKNLMVVNRDEDESIPHEQAHAHTQINHLTSQFPTFSGVSPSNVSNQVYHSFFPNSTQGSIVIGQDQHNTEEQCFDARYPSSFRTHASLKKPHMLSQGPGSLISNQHKDSGFMAPIEPHDYKVDENISAPQHTYSKNRPIVASTSHMERVITIPNCQHKNALSTANPNEEIIIIDDGSESEADLISDVAKYSGELGENHVVSLGTLFPSCSNSTLVNPLPCYHQLHDHSSLRSESPVLHNTSFSAVNSRRANTSYVRWSCTPEGSCVLQQSPHNATSSARGHMSSALYNSSSLL